MRLIRASLLTGFASIAVVKITRTFDFSLAATSALSIISKLNDGTIVGVEQMSMYVQLHCCAFSVSFPLVRPLSHRLATCNLCHHRQGRDERSGETRAICAEP